MYEISSGCYLPEVCPSKSFKFEKVEDSQVRNFVTFIFSVNAKKSYKKAVKQVGNNMHCTCIILLPQHTIVIRHFRGPHTHVELSTILGCLYKFIKNPK